MSELPALTARMKALFNKAGIPVKDITLTRVTVIVEMHGEKHTKDVALMLAQAGWTNVKILDDSPTIFCASPNWRVTGLMLPA
jgi:hypothetical protein